MNGIKIELLVIAIILLGIAVTTNNFWGYVLILKKRNAQFLAYRELCICVNKYF